MDYSRGDTSSVRRIVSIVAGCNGGCAPTKSASYFCNATAFTDRHCPEYAIAPVGPNAADSIARALAYESANTANPALRTTRHLAHAHTVHTCRRATTRRSSARSFVTMRSSS